MRKLQWWIVIPLWLVAAPLYAQTGALTQATIQYWQNGAQLPAQTQTIPLPAGALCGQPLFPTPPPPVTCITTTARIVWADPADATKVCIAVQAPGSVLLALPLGANYAATMTFTNDFNITGGASGLSNTFLRGACQTPPVAPAPQIRQ